MWHSPGGTLCKLTRWSGLNVKKESLSPVAALEAGLDMAESLYAGGAKGKMDSEGAGQVRKRNEGRCGQERGSGCRSQPHRWVKSDTRCGRMTVSLELEERQARTKKGSLTRAGEGQERRDEAVDCGDSRRLGDGEMKA